MSSLGVTQLFREFIKLLPQEADVRLEKNRFAWAMIVEGDTEDIPLMLSPIYEWAKNNNLFFNLDFPDDDSSWVRVDITPIKVVVLQ